MKECIANERVGIYGDYGGQDADFVASVMVRKRAQVYIIGKGIAIWRNGVSQT